MTDADRAWRRAVRQVADLARTAVILYRHGLFHPLRPVDDLRTLRVARRGGPFAAMIADNARRNPDRTAVIDAEGELSYGALDATANAVARGLKDLGLQPGSVVALLCRDHRGTVTALVALGRLGARPLLLNTGLARPQLCEVVNRENVAAVIVDTEFRSLTDALDDVIPRIIATPDAHPPQLSLHGFAAGHAVAPLPLPALSAGMVLLTSGSTGLPKGAGRERISPLHSARLLDRIPLTADAAMVLATPLSHATGLGLFMLAMALGKPVVLSSGPFDAAATLASIARYRADTLVVVPTMLRRMLDTESPAPLRACPSDSGTLRIVVSAGAPIPPELCLRVADALGAVLYNMYGSTEVAIVSVATPTELALAPGAVGRPPLGCRVEIYDAERNRVSRGEVGTIFVANGMSFTGYTDGSGKERIGDLVSTGDIGHVDEHGLLHIDGRDDDMIVSGGENVYPLEVEHLLVAHPGVIDAAVVGVADADFGKRLRVFLVTNPDGAPTAAEIRDYVKAHLARHKVPRDVIFVSEIPRNVAGKIVRRELDRMVVPR